MVDASIALAWCFEDESDLYAESILRSLAETRLLVPAHWFLEVSNALIHAERKSRIRPADTMRAVALFEALPMDSDTLTGEKALVETLALARTYGLTTYDAAYLELALRENLPMATLDTDLLKAAKAAGAKLAG